MKVLIAALALASMLVGGEALVAPAATEAAAPCRVRNLTQDTRGSSLKRMVERTRNGDKLIMRGTCAGLVRIRTDIVIEGKGKAPAITGRGKTRVVWVKRGATVVLKRLRVQRGFTPLGKSGAGIRNAGRLTLRKVIVRKNHGGRAGGGIWNKGRLTIIDSIVRGNCAFYGIYNEEGRLTIIDSIVRGNSGFGISNEEGRLTIIDSIVRGNSGFGIRNLAGQLTITGSTISGNTAPGLIWNTGEATLTDTAVTGNKSHRVGGGINTSGPITLVRSTVSGNEARRGGGISVSAGCFRGCWNGEIVLIDSEVTGNTATDVGGGIYASFSDGLGKVTLEGSSSVHDNVPDDCVGTTAC